MQNRYAASMALLVGASLLTACTNSGLVAPGVTTSSVQPAGTSTGQTAQQQTPKVDPACVALAAKIDTLRRDGVVERVEKASVGTSPNVTVKRSSLALIAELDKANAEFQARCSPLGPRPTTAAIAPAQAPVTTATSSSQATVAPIVTQAQKP